MVEEGALVGVGGLQEATNFPPPIQGSARPRVGAQSLVLGTLWRRYSGRGSAGVASIAPSRREVGRGPAARCALIPGEGGVLVAGLTSPYKEVVLNECAPFMSMHSGLPSVW